MRDVETAESENILVVCPFAFHQADIETLFFEKSLFDRGEDWGFAGKSDISDPDLVRLAG
jgi:hypothetical protein